MYGSALYVCIMTVYIDVCAPMPSVRGLSFVSIIFVLFSSVLYIAVFLSVLRAGYGI